MIEVFKMFKGMDDVNVSDFFELSETNRDEPRWHNFKIKTKTCKLDIRKYSFSLRVVYMWNRLSPNTVNSESLNVFKSRLDSDMNKIDYDQFL